MAEKLDTKPKTNMRVTGMNLRIEIDPKIVSIKPQPPPVGEQESLFPSFKFSLSVDVEGKNSRVYDHVISTIPLGMLRLVDTRFCGISEAQQEAIRTLHYDASVKVAIKFTKRWWEGDKYKQKGGKSNTDRPTRVVVYPSYGIGGNDAVLLASYTWSQDAMRFGALVKGKESKAERILIEVILRDIGDIFDISSQDLSGMYLDHHAWDWYHDEFSSGKAFTFQCCRTFVFTV